MEREATELTQETKDNIKKIVQSADGISTEILTQSREASAAGDIDKAIEILEHGKTIFERIGKKL